MNAFQTSATSIKTSAAALLLDLAALLVLLLAIPSSTHAEERERPRVGVVLSGGGAKGAAHVGVLRAVEEAGLPIDYIVGTSMGSIVGGLYAMGYSTAQLDSLFRHQDWNFVLSDQPPRRLQSLAEREWNERFVLTVPLGREGRPRQSGLLRGQNLGNLLARLTVGYHDSIAFDSLTIPFACVATNLATGQEVVFRNGVPSTAIRASMAIPGVFTPVTLHGATLVDGGLTNNYPADVARQMGADIVIGSTVQKPYTDSLEFSTVYGVLDQVVSLMCRRKYEDNVRGSDLCLRIPVTDYSTMDFSPTAIDSILARGYATATAHRQQLDSLRRCVFGDDAEATLPVRTPSHLMVSDTATFAVRHINFERISPSDAAAVKRASHLTANDRVNFAQIEEALRLLRDKFLYVDVDYALTSSDHAYDLRFRATGRSRSKVGAGAHFDTEEMAVVLLGANLQLGTRTPSHLSLLGKLGEQYFVRLGYALEPSLYKLVSLGYEFGHNDFDINRRGRRAYNLSYNRHTLTASYAHLRIRNFSGELGLRLTYYDYGDFLSGEADLQGLHDDLYFTGFARLQYNSQDKGYYPTRGSKFVAEGTFTTDNLSYLGRPHAFETVSASWETVWCAGKRLAFLPRISGRVLWGNDVPFPFHNAFGGDRASRYVEQQIAFVGVSRLEPARNALVTFDLKARYNIYGRHYVTGIADAGVEGDKFSRLHRGRYLYGLGLQYGFDTKFGPIEATFSYSSNSEKLLFFLSVGFCF